MQDFSTTSIGRKDCVLVADDADIGRGILRALLRKEYDVIEARNGLEVIQLLRSSPGDIACILLDVMMPVMDGIKVLRFMRENDLLDRIPAVAISAISDADGKIGCYEAGAVDIIEKPYDEKLLLYKVRHIIDQFRRRRDASAGGGDPARLAYVQSVLDALPVAVFVQDAATGTIRYCNALFRQLPGCPADPTGATLDSVVPADARATVKAAANDLLARRVQRPAEIEDPGTGRHYAVVFNALQDEDGSVTDLVGAVVNTTGETRLRRQLDECLRALPPGKAPPR